MVDQLTLTRLQTGSQQQSLETFICIKCGKDTVQKKNCDTKLLYNGFKYLISNLTNLIIRNREYGFKRFICFE